MASPPSPSPRKLTSQELKEIEARTKSHQFVFVEPFPKEVQYECAVCLEVLQVPRITNCCGNRFCLKCIQSLRYRKCPLCNVHGLKHFPDKKLERLINQREVYCVMKKEGCDWKGEFFKMSSHLGLNGRNESTICQFLPAPCEYCNEYIKVQNMEEHKTQCSSRPIDCKYCGSQVRYNQLRIHYYKFCKGDPVVCPNEECSVAMISSLDLIGHLQSCPWSLLNCEFQHAGCSAYILRKNMDEHLKENMAVHLSMVKKKLRRLEDEKESKGRVSFLVISDLPDDALSEQKLKSRFGMFGPLSTVKLLDLHLRAAIVMFIFEGAYDRVLEKSRKGGIKLCKEFVQVNPVYSAKEDCLSTGYLSDEFLSSLY